MKRLDQISSSCLLLLAAAISIQSYKLSLGTWAEPGPGFFPMGSGVALGFISFLILLHALLTPKLKEGSLFWPGKTGIKKIVLVVLTLLLYSFFLEILGFLLCTFIGLIFLLRVIEPQKWFPAISFAVITTLISYVVFEMVLKSQLPRGIIPGP